MVEDDRSDILDKLPIGVVSCDMEGNITYINDHLVGLLDLSSVKDRKQINLLSFPPLVKAGISSVLRNALNNLGSGCPEVSCKSVAFKELVLDLRLSPKKNVNGNITGYHAIVEDRTALQEKASMVEYIIQKDRLISDISSRFINSSLKDIDKEVYLALKKTANFIDAKRANIYIVDEDERFVRKTHEWHSDDVVSHISLNRRFPRHKLALKQLEALEVMNVSDVQQLPESESEVKRTLDRLGVVSFLAVPLTYDGRLSGFIAIDSTTEKEEWDESISYLLKVVGEMITSILERKHTETLLLKKDEDYENVINSLDAIIWKADVDRKGDIVNTYISESADRILGLEPGSINNSWDRYFSYVHPEDVEDMFKVLHSSFQKPGFFTGADYRLVRKDGTEFWVNSSGSAHAQKDGTLKLFGTTTNIMQRKEAEDALLKAKVTAEAANRTKSEFLTNMSHELRTPLNAIIGFSDIMVEETFGELSPKYQTYVQRISQSGHHLLNMINDILDLSKVEVGTIRILPEFIDVDDLLHEMVTMMEPLASDKDIDINIRRHGDTKELFADRAKIKQIMYNLLGNSIKFTPNGGEITVVAGRDNGMISVSIIDTGIGISAEDQKKLFKPFTQLEASMSRRYEGTGLGLALVKELVELHGGRIWVESEVGNGSNFTFEIPNPNQNE
ncbi:ATP-binding protein [Methanolobus sp. WCC4]|uniref:ATP-binding protein n=1 Tax=Methanolobus sp. WCC4 TaxID=3125784 RepID=UPI0030F57EEE